MRSVPAPRVLLGQVLEQVHLAAEAVVVDGGAVLGPYHQDGADRRGHGPGTQRRAVLPQAYGPHRAVGVAGPCGDPCLLEGVVQNGVVEGVRGRVGAGEVCRRHQFAEAGHEGAGAVRTVFHESFGESGSQQRGGRAVLGGVGSGGLGGLGLDHGGSRSFQGGCGQRTAVGAAHRLRCSAFSASVSGLISRM